ncbi:hypothetical protein H0B56_12260 [Haloechinothrix sp. YIM 98757]|uniref:Uncharacterized protein n=1 Tax=Haloechinothrix aidingensis TaxID=2752311 RepID=A0A838AAS4_9PSEU|nr:hypothetical protein [Haloechinothrix aidingensis]MBA0126316.1 hypothetical protein [Haloechinothrix aidingensis]
MTDVERYKAAADAAVAAIARMRRELGLTDADPDVEDVVSDMHNDVGRLVAERDAARAQRDRAVDMHVATTAVLSAVRESLGFVDYADDERVIEDAQRLHRERQAVCRRLGAGDEDAHDVVERLIDEFDEARRIQVEAQGTVSQLRTYIAALHEAIGVAPDAEQLDAVRHAAHLRQAAERARGDAT